MTIRTTAARLTLAALLAGSTVAPATALSADAAPVKYKNCTALNAKYAHGVKKSKTTLDRYTSSGKTRTRVSKAVVNLTLYKANTHLDRDKDGIACEK